MNCRFPPEQKVAAAANIADVELIHISAKKQSSWLIVSQPVDVGNYRRDAMATLSAFPYVIALTVRSARVARLPLSPAWCGPPTQTPSTPAKSPFSQASAASIERKAPMRLSLPNTRRV